MRAGSAITNRGSYEEIVVDNEPRMTGAADSGPIGGTKNALLDIISFPLKDEGNSTIDNTSDEPSDEALARIGTTAGQLKLIDRNTLPIMLAGPAGSQFTAWIRSGNGEERIQGRCPQVVLASAAGKVEIDVLMESNTAADPIHIRMNRFSGTMHGKTLGARLRQDGLALRDAELGNFTK